MMSPTTFQTYPERGTTTVNFPNRNTTVQSRTKVKIHLFLRHLLLRLRRQGGVSLAVLRAPLASRVQSSPLQRLKDKGLRLRRILRSLRHQNVARLRKLRNQPDASQACASQIRLGNPSGSGSPP